jgi:hypothetical protein
LLCVPLSEPFWSVSSKHCSLCSLRVSKIRILQHQSNFPLASSKCDIKFLLTFFTSKHKSWAIIIFELASVFFKYFFLTQTVKFTTIGHWPPFFALSLATWSVFLTKVSSTVISFKKFIMCHCIAHLFYFPFQRSQFYSFFFQSICFTRRHSFLFPPSHCLLHFLKIQNQSHYCLTQLPQLHSEFLNSSLTSTIPRFCVLNNF